MGGERWKADKGSAGSRKTRQNGSHRHEENHRHPRHGRLRGHHRRRLGPCAGMGQGVPVERQGEPPQGDVRDAIRPDAGRGPLRAEGGAGGRKAPRPRRERPVRRHEGAVERPLRDADGGARVRGAGL